MKKITLIIALAFFISSNAQNVTTNGTILLDDATSRTRVVVDAFLNSSNKVHELIEEIAPSGGGSSGDWQFVTNTYQIATNALTRQEAEAGFTEWVVAGLVDGESVFSPPSFVPGSTRQWSLRIMDSGGVDHIYMALSADGKNATNLVFNGDRITATRTRFPTMADLDGLVSYASFTNDVCNIVTNEVWRWSEWEWGDVIYEGNVYKYVAGVEYGDTDYRGDYVYNTHIDPYVSEIYYLVWNQGQYEDLSIDNLSLLSESDYEVVYEDTEDNKIVLSRIRITRNSLGLARLTDIAPIVSNNVTKAYIEDLGIESGVDAQTITNMTTLSPVYSQTPTFSKWMMTPAKYEGYPITVIETPVDDVVVYTAVANGTGIDSIEGSSTALSVTWDSFGIIATRTRTDIIGYTLGTQTNSVLAATNSLISASTATNIASTVSSNAIASADTTYRRTIGLTNLNQSVQYVNITDTTPTTLAISMPTDGATKDWMVYVVSVTNVSLVLPPETWWMADTAYTNDVPPATPTALWFSQVTDGIFILGRQELTEVTAP